MGMLGSAIPFLDPYANLPAWLDRHLVPATHLYHQGFYDPEGLLSTIPAVASTLLGTLTGIWIRREQPATITARGLLLAGLLCMAGGLLWSHWFPMNKRLWTSSFVLWTGGISLLTLCFFFWLVDLRKSATRLIYPAVVFGTNALAAYVFSEFLASLPRHAPALRLRNIGAALAIPPIGRRHSQPQRRRPQLCRPFRSSVFCAGPGSVPQACLFEGMTYRARIGA
jgi:hypothetical protein